MRVPSFELYYLRIMTITLYMAMSINAMIADRNEKTSWSDEEWNSYCQMVASKGNVVVGAKTYPLYFDEDFAKMGDPLIVVLSKSGSIKEPRNGRKDVVVTSVDEALAVLKEKGFTDILVTGGGQVDTAFVEKNLIDEIYLDIEPFLFGKGIPLFYPFDLDLELELVDSKMINENTIQVHYKLIS